MDPSRSRRNAAVLGLVGALAACSSGGSSSGLVSSADSEAHADRLAMYEFYLESEGRPPAWVDQKLCVQTAAFALVSEVYRHAYPQGDHGTGSLEETTVAASLIGDEPLQVALSEVENQAGVVADSDVTLRSAIDAVVDSCSTALVGREVLEEEVQWSIDMSLSLFGAHSYDAGGPVWLPPDGTKRWFAPLEWSPEWSTERAAGTDPAGLQVTFEAMIEAMAVEGEAGLKRYLANPESGDRWGISNHAWVDPQCSENVAEQSGCVAEFAKDGTSLEVVFIFTVRDGAWQLVESYVSE